MLEKLSFNKRMIIDFTWKGLLAGLIAALVGLVVKILLIY